MTVPSRRNFLAALPALALAGPAAAGPAPTPAARPPVGHPSIPRDPALDIDRCDCAACVRARVARDSHPLHAAALVAVFKARDALLTLHHAHDCGHADLEDWRACEVCHDAAMMSDSLNWTETALACAYGGRAQDGAWRQERASGLHREALREGRQPPLPPRVGKNHPAHEPAVLALLDARDALGALHEGHGCAGWCGVCNDAEAGAYLAGLFVDLLQSRMVPTAAVLRRENPDLDPEYLRVLDLMEEKERRGAAAA